MMNDGHTNLHYYSKNEKHLNIPFLWIEEGLVVNKSTEKYLIGDKILSIGGKTPVELEKLLKEQVSCENKYWIRAQSINYLRNEMYLKYYDLINDNETVDIEIEREGKKIVFKEPLKNTLSKFMFSKPCEWKEWHIEKKNNLGYFRFDSWPGGEYLEELKGNIDEFFKEISENHIGNIVFDIRKNQGGIARTLNYLLTYLDTDTVYAEEYREYINLPKVDDSLLFRGNTYLMTSNESYSCSVYATTILKDNGIVKTIGEPTGENPAFNRHGSGSDGKMPETGWEFMMTSHKPQRPLDNDESEISIFPDIPVYTTSENIVLGIDAQMEKMREIARGEEDITYHDKTIICSPDEEWTLKEGKNFKIIDKNKIVFLDKKSHVKNIFIEDTENRERTNVEFVKEGNIINFKIPPKCAVGKGYHIYYKFDNGAITAVRLAVQPELKVKSEFFITGKEKCKYNTKYTIKYLQMRFSKEIDAQISKINIKLTDESGKKYRIMRIERGVGAHKWLIITPYKELQKGKYTLFIPKGTIKSEDDDVYEDDISVEFIVE